MAQACSAYLRHHCLFYIDWWFRSIRWTDFMHRRGRQYIQINPNLNPKPSHKP